MVDGSAATMNRVIIKKLLDRCLGQYETYSDLEERHALRKFKETAAGHTTTVEGALSLYDDDEVGEITISDLREGLMSIDMYDGRDKKSFEALAIYFLRKNNENW